jgi:hypothetical protein
MTRPTDKPETAHDGAAKAQSSIKADANDATDAIPPNPPRTTTGGWFTAPKFGSAGSGGAELEPGPVRD